MAKCQACHIFIFRLYVGLENPCSARKGSIWGKIRKRVCNFLIFAIMLLRFKKAISHHMYLGHIVEIGPTEAVMQKSRHPYAKVLLAGVSVPDTFYQLQRIIIPGEVPSPRNIPSGCRFHPHCRVSRNSCIEQSPSPEMAEDDVMVACSCWND